MKCLPLRVGGLDPFILLSFLRKEVNMKCFILLIAAVMLMVAVGVVGAQFDPSSLTGSQALAYVALNQVNPFQQAVNAAQQELNDFVSEYRKRKRHNNRCEPQPRCRKSLGTNNFEVERRTRENALAAAQGNLNRVLVGLDSLINPSTRNYTRDHCIRWSREIAGNPSGNPGTHSFLQNCVAAA